MNSTLWKMLLGTTLGAAATEEAEAAWAPASLFKAFGKSDEGIDALSTLSGIVERRVRGKRPDSLPRMDKEQWNRNLWETGSPHPGIQVQPNRYMYDDAGNLQVWIDDHWSKDDLAKKVMEVITPSDPQFGARMQFQADDLINPKSELAQLLPGGGKHLTIRASPDAAWDTKGSMLYDPNTGGGRLTLGSNWYNTTNLGMAHVVDDLAGVADHEITHLLQNLAGQQAGTNPDLIFKTARGIPESLWNGTKADDIYWNTLGEKMARAGESYVKYGGNPFVSLNALERPSYIPDEFPDRFGGEGYPYRARSYGTPYPHKPSGVVDKGAEVLSSLAKGAVSDPGTYVGLIPKLGGIGPALGMWASDLGESGQLPEGELAKQLEEAKRKGLISAITGGGF